MIYSLRLLICTHVYCIFTSHVTFVNFLIFAGRISWCWCPSQTGATTVPMVLGGLKPMPWEFLVTDHLRRSPGIRDHATGDRLDFILLVPSLTFTCFCFAGHIYFCHTPFCRAIDTFCSLNQHIQCLDMLNFQILGFNSRCLVESPLSMKSLT